MRFFITLRLCGPGVFRLSMESASFFPLFTPDPMCGILYTKVRERNILADSQAFDMRRYLKKANNRNTIRFGETRADFLCPLNEKCINWNCETIFSFSEGTMKSIYDNYTRLDTKGRITYFAGANTADGFVGSYKDIADERNLERLYIIKGGAGTGKSTLMRNIADSAEILGYEVEYYLCGSDPESLDCVILDGRIAVLDGTAPHILDMSYPGASSSLIDVSKYWDCTALEERRNEIVANCTEKAACYASAYRYLRAVAAIEREKSSLVERIFDREKSEKFISRFVKKLGKTENGTASEKNRYTHAITMRGKFSVPTFSEISEKNYVVKDYLASAPGFMQILRDKLLRRGFSIITERIPTENYIAGIYITDCKTFVTIGESAENAKMINMSRFIRENAPAEIKGRLRLCTKCGESCMDEAIRNMGCAAEHHFALEEIYKKAMNFSALSRYTSKICDEIMERLVK